MNAKRLSINAFAMQIFRTHGRMIIAGDALVADLGLTSARWQVLGAIALFKEPPLVADLARSLGVTRQGVQRLVNELVAQGALALERCPDDRRARLVRMTPKGEEACKEAERRWGEWALEIGQILSEEDVQAATASLSKFQRYVEERTRGMISRGETKYAIASSDRVDDNEETRDLLGENNAEGILLHLAKA